MSKTLPNTKYTIPNIKYTLKPNTENLHLNGGSAEGAFASVAGPRAADEGGSTRQEEPWTTAGGVGIGGGSIGGGRIGGVGGGAAG